MSEPANIESVPDLNFREVLFYAQTRPGMYIGGTTVSYFEAYLAGYAECYRNNGSTSDKTARLFFDGFRDFVVARHGGKDMTTHGVGILVHEAGMDLKQVLSEIANFFSTQTAGTDKDAWRPAIWSEKLEAMLQSGNSENKENRT